MLTVEHTMHSILYDMKFRHQTTGTKNDCIYRIYVKVIEFEMEWAEYESFLTDMTEYVRISPGNLIQYQLHILSILSVARLLLVILFFIHI